MGVLRGVILRYVWPKGDKAPWRIIQKPAGKAWGAFKILGTQMFPIGDFDEGIPRLNEPHRIYKTHKGYRVFYTGRVDPDLDAMLAVMKRNGADETYCDIASRRRYYAARIEPKYPSAKNNDWAICQLVAEYGQRNTAWNEIINIHDMETGIYMETDNLV